MRARLLPLACASLFWACKLSSSPSGETPACQGAPATLLAGASIWTGNAEQPEADALLIRADRVVSLGEVARAHEGIEAGCLRELDMSGRAIVPGIIDGHTHVRELGMDAVKVDLVGVADMTEIVERLQRAHPNPKAGEWIVGQGWDEGAFASAGYPDRASLDAAFPASPVALESLHGFAGMFNGAALRVAGVDANTPNPEGGTILRREDGEATGVMLALAQGLVREYVPPPSVEQRSEAIVAALELMASAGVTSVHEAGMSAPDVEAFIRLADEGRLPLRVYGMLTGNDEELMRHWFERGPLDHPSGRLNIRGIKVFYDGSLGSRTAVMAEAYNDAPEHAAPAERISPERMLELGIQAAQKGFQMAVHAIGDEGNRRVLETYAKALEGHPQLDHRWRIEHAQVVGKDFFSDAARLGVIASMQPSHAVGDSAWAEDRVGAERISRAYAWRSMLDAGIELIFNSDLPGEPWRPMETLYFAVTRMKLDGTPPAGWYAQQALTVEESLRAMTSSSARAAFAEGELGQLAPGMKADFVVLGADPRTVDPVAIKDIAVQQTWLDGEVIWSVESDATASAPEPEQ